MRLALKSFAVLALLVGVAHAECVSLCDGQTVECWVRGRCRAGLTMNIDGTNVFVETERICDPVYSYNCGCCGRVTVIHASSARTAVDTNKIFYDGRYVTVEERAADEARLKLEAEDVLRAPDTKAADAQRAKGFVPYYGRWVTPGEREQLRAEALEQQTAPKAKVDAAPPATPPEAPAANAPRPKIRTEWISGATRDDGTFVPGHYRVIKEKE